MPVRQEIIRNTAGDRNHDWNRAVAANQTIVKGDPVFTNAGGLVEKAAVGATGIAGFAEHDVTTGGTVTEKDRVIYARALTNSEFKGELATAAGAATQALVNTTAGFVVQDGIYKVDPAAAVKQLRIIKVVEGGTGNNRVVFKVIPANVQEG